MKGNLIYFLIFLLCCAHSSVKAQYQIIPKPLETVIGSDHFSFSINYSIESNSSDLHLQKSFKDWVKNTALNNIQSNKMVQTKLSLMWVGPKKWTSYLHKLRLKESFNPGNEGYVISIEKNSILVLAQSEVGLFYGFQSLQQLFKQQQIPCGQIYDKPSFAIRAWQDDISRGPIPTLSQLKKEIEILSHYKLNYFTLYTEHVFKYVQHPGIAPADGISAADIIALKAFAKLHHVQLIANQQSFGHLEKLLNTPGYQDLAESKHIISPANARTYPLLKNFFEEQNKAYGSRFFHINADETFGLGSGQNKELANSMGIGNLYAFHIKKLNKLLQEQGNTLVMWSDIIASYPEIIPQLPKDIVLVPWAYDGAESFINYLKPIAESGFSFWVAPGINNWLNLYPNQLASKDNIYNLVRDGHQLGATAVLNTSWDDDGFALFGNNWQGFIWGADISWNAPQTNTKSDERWKQFEENFDVQFWQGNMQKWAKELYAMHQTNVLNPLRNSTLFEPILPFYPAYVHAEKELTCQQQKEKIENLLIAVQQERVNSLIGKEALNYFIFSLQLAHFACQKNLFRIQFYKQKNRNQNNFILDSEIENLEKQIVQLKESFTTLYLQENRPYWLDINLAKFDQLAQQIKQMPFYIELQAEDKITRKGRKYSLVGNRSQAQILYTFGKYNLQVGSAKYTKPIYSKHNMHLKSGYFYQGKMQYMREDTFVFHKAIGSIQHINLQASKYHPSYISSGKMALVDGKIGSVQDLKSGLWQGYSGADLQIDLMLNQAQNTQSFAMGFYQNTPSWVVLPKQVEIYLSENGETYYLFKTITHQVPVNLDEAIKHTFAVTWPKKKVKHVRIVAKYSGNLPEKHPGAGNPSMIFADEIILQ